MVQNSLTVNVSTWLAKSLVILLGSKNSTKIVINAGWIINYSVSLQTIQDLSMNCKPHGE